MSEYNFIKSKDEWSAKPDDWSVKEVFIQWRMRYEKKG